MQSIWDVWLIGAGSNSNSFIYFENKNELCKVVGFLLQVKGIGSAGLTREKSILKQKPTLGLPWWRSGWESACRCRGHGFGPWSGRVPHAAERLGPWAAITEPARLEPVLHNGGGRGSERPAHRDEEWPPLATTREKALAQRRGPNTVKNK